MMVTSGKEVTESTYVLSDKTVGSGFYPFEMRVTQTNGKSDSGKKPDTSGAEHKHVPSVSRQS